MKNLRALFCVLLCALCSHVALGQITVTVVPSGNAQSCGDANGTLSCSQCGTIIAWQQGSYTDPANGAAVNFTGPDQSTNGPDQTFVVSSQTNTSSNAFQYSVPVSTGSSAYRAVYTSGSVVKYSWPVRITSVAPVNGPLTMTTSTTAFLNSGSGKFLLSDSSGTVQWWRFDANNFAAVPLVHGKFSETQTSTYYATLNRGSCTAQSNYVTIEVYNTGSINSPISVSDGDKVNISHTYHYKTVIQWEYSTDGSTWTPFDYNSYGKTYTNDKFADTHEITTTTQFRVKVDLGPFGTDYTNIITVPYVPYSQVNPSPTNGANYVRQQQVTTSGVSKPSAVEALTSQQKHESITYLDGNGRSVQQNSRQASPLQKDVVSMAVYDGFGRQPVQYLPYVSSTNDGAYRSATLSEQAAYYANGTGDKVADSSYPFAATVFDPSPLGRAMEQGSTGTEFQPGGGHTKTVQYNNNVAGDVRLFASDGTSTSFYNANDLALTQGTDEDQKQTQTFTDKAGNTILTRVQADATTVLETYYIYNTAGNVNYILSPKGVAALKAASWAMSPSILNQYANQFVYDVRGRLAQKKVPGQAWMYYCYDRFDRLVLMQDANTHSLHKWVFIKYDRRGRAVMQGLYTNTTDTTQAMMQKNELDPLYAANTDLYYEERGSAAHGYTNQSFPTTATEIQSVNYYDNYDLDNNTVDDVTYQTQGLSGEGTPAYSVFGLPTASKRLVLDGGTTWLYKYVFYDDRSRPIQTQSNNHLSSATPSNIVTSVYDFEGKVTLSKNYHYAGTGKQTTVINKMVYDAAGRPLQVYQNNNGAPSDQLIAQYQYNELGQLVDKKLHSADGINFLQSIDYRYDIQGRITSLNNAQLTSDGILNDESNDYFGMEYLYQTTQTGLTTTSDALYNGNLSAVKWKAAGTASGAADQKSYKFAYDKANRLTAATFQQSTTATAWSKEANVQNESMSYDLNGNITTLNRQQRKNQSLYNYTAENIDALNYSYSGTNGDQLQTVTDGATGTPAAGFDNGTSGTSSDYTYDKHGNLIKDNNKGISNIVYNHLGKPTTITYSDGRHVDYTYDAAGTKLTVKAYAAGGTLQTTTDYVNNFVYENSTLSFFSSPEGRVVNNAGTLEYQYAISDQQGNTRVVFTSAAQTPVAPLATFEGDANDNASQYLNSATNIVSFGSANHTPSGSKVVKMNQSYKLGPSQSLAVFPGDKIDMEVWEYHEGSSGYGTTSTALSTLITNVALIFGGTSGGAGDAGLKYNGVNNAFGLFGTGGNQGDTRPAAYLNYILFDRNYNVLDAGWNLAPSTTFTKQKLSLNTLNIKEPGFVFVYLSYDDNSNNPVYFDDFKVTQTKTNIVQYNEYYPYGMQSNTSWTRSDVTGNKFLGNGGTEVNTTTGLYDLAYRNYDPAIGRFMQVDPLAHKNSSTSPFVYSLNNPVYFNDPTGLIEASMQQILDFVARSLNGYGGNWSSGASDPTYYQSQDEAFEGGVDYVNENNLWSSTGAGSENQSRKNFSALMNSVNQPQGKGMNLIISFLPPTSQNSSNWEIRQAKSLKDAQSIVKLYVDNGYTIDNLVLFGHGASDHINCGTGSLSINDYDEDSDHVDADIFKDISNMVVKGGNMILVGCNAGELLGYRLDFNNDINLYMNKDYADGIISHWSDDSSTYMFLMDEPITKHPYQGWVNFGTMEEYQNLIIYSNGTIEPVKK